MSGTPLELLAPAALVLVAALVARFRPAWVFPALIVAVPLRLPVFPQIEIATLLLLGAACGRASQIVAAVRAEPIALGAAFALPASYLLSAMWARQPTFVFPAAAKWIVLWLAMALVAADDTLRPRRVVVSALVAMVPMALWAAAERLRLIAPLGDPRVLRNRAIDLVYMVRGRALFWHPNRLAEFSEQIGLLLVGCGMAGVLPRLCWLGVAAAILGIWGTDSKAGFATIVGGAVLAVAWLRLSAVARRRAVAIGGVGVACALVVAVWAYWSHGGIGTRVMVYRYAWQLIEQHPLLGVGGGNWALAIGNAPLSVSRFWFRTHAHSLPLQLAVEVGVLGVLIGVVSFAVPLWRAARGLAGCSPEWRGVVYGSIVGVLGLLAHNLVHYFLRDAVDGILTGMLLGLAIAGVRLGVREGVVTVAAPAPAGA